MMCGSPLVVQAPARQVYMGSSVMSFALKVAAISAVLAMVLGVPAAIAHQPGHGAAYGIGRYGGGLYGPGLYGGGLYGGGLYGGGLYGGGLYGGWWPGLYWQEDPPYFALYPPVYYSHPIPRPYGFSPYAYPPGTMTPEVIRVQPLMVPNPFVPQLAAVERPSKTTGPLRIRNPFVAQPETGMAAFNGLTDLPASRPQIVYPADSK
jgi:hypothetical protein